MTTTEHDAAVERVARAICADDYAASGDTEKQLWDDPDWRHVCGKMYLDFARAAIAALATTPPREDSGEVAREEKILELGGMVDSLETECANHLAEVARLRGELRRIEEGNLGDAPWQANYDRIRQVARAALESQAGVK